MNAEIGAITVIAYRDLLKFLRDRARIVSTLIFPIFFVLILGRSFDSNIAFGYDFQTFVFVGVLAQTMFQSSALGIISLIEDRENDFSQAMFVAPISRYSIVGGKIAGESLVSLAQGAVVVLFGALIGISISVGQAAALLPVAIAVCLFGGAFGLFTLSNLSSQRAANQIFPFIILPQFFLAGVFNPIRELPWYLDVISRISPMRYAVDLARAVFYAGSDEYAETVLASAGFNLAVMTVAFAVFLLAGTYLFVRREKNR